MGRDFLDDVLASVGQGGGGTERDRQPGQQEHWKRQRGRDRLQADTEQEHWKHQRRDCSPQRCGVHAGTQLAKLRGAQMAQMAAGRAQSRQKAALKHHKHILLQHVRSFNVHGAMRAGSEVKLIDAKKGGKRNTGGQTLQLCSRRSKTAGKGKYQSVGPLCRLDMAFGVEQRSKVVGRMYQLGAKAVALNRAVVAEVFLEMQLRWLRHLVERAKEHAPLAVVTQRKWDETRQLVTMPLRPGEKPSRDHVEVMVSSLRLVTLWENGGILVLDTVSPPCPLLSASATHIYAALHGHPLLAEFVAAAKLLRSFARTRIHLNEFDGASGNDKLHAADARHPSLTDLTTMYEYLLCSNHQQHLVSLSVLAMLSLELTNIVLTSAYFLSFNGHWSRLIACTRQIVDSKLVISYEKPEEHWADYAIELAHFILRSVRMDVDDSVGNPDDLDKPSKRSNHIQHAMFEDVSEFIKVFNGAWWAKGS